MIFVFLHFLADKNVILLLFIHCDGYSCNFLDLTNKNMNMFQVRSTSVPGPL